MSAEYRITTKGKTAIRHYDYICPECKYHEDISVDMRDKPDGFDVMKDLEVICPECKGKEVLMGHVWLRAPSVITAPGSDQDIKNMQESFKQRFVKGPEIDEVRHKHGKLYDDGVRSAAVQRIRRSLENEK